MGTVALKVFHVKQCGFNPARLDQKAVKTDRGHRTDAAIGHAKHKGLLWLEKSEFTLACWQTRHFFLKQTVPLKKPSDR